MCVFLDVDPIKPLQLLFKSLILFLILRFNIFYAFKTFFSSFKLLSPTRNLILEFTFILAQLFNCFNHFTHLFLLRINNVADTFFNILLFRVCVQVARNRVQELNRVVSCFFEFFLLTEHVKKFCAAFSNFSCKLAGSFQILQF